MQGVTAEQHLSSVLRALSPFILRSVRNEKRVFIAEFAVLSVLDAHGVRI